MKRNYIIPLVILIILLVVFLVKLSDFTQKTDKKLLLEKQLAKVEKNEDDSEEIKSIATHTAKKITIEDTHPVGASLSTVIIKPIGFKVDTTIRLFDIDPLKKVLVADLDKNGFDEIYLITQSAGSGSYGKVFGFASDLDKRLLPINAEEINESDDVDGYRGHDSYAIEDSCLVREFPVYQENDTNAQPTGGIKRLRYSLVPAKAGYQLKIKL